MPFRCEPTSTISIPFSSTHHHTSTHELAGIANKARPKLLVLTHVLFWGAAGEDLLNEIAESYDGKVIVGKDLDVY